MTTGGAAICAREVRKAYGSNWALDGFDLSVPAGTVCGLLGPNGAGKTTAVRVLATLLQFDSGYVEVAGVDVRSNPRRVRERIGLVAQQAAVDEDLSGRDNLVMFGRLYHLGSRRSKARADEMLEQFQLTVAADRPVSGYSGGMRRRLDIAASLIIAPRVLFLDEPSTGLDPRNRNEVWDAIRRLAVQGTTVLLTTQYLEEADQLAEQIAVIDGGRVIAEGTPSELKSAIGGDQLDVVVRETGLLSRTVDIVARAATASPTVDGDRRRVSAPVSDRVRALTDVARDLADQGVEVEDIAVRRPSLDEVFLRLTDSADSRAHSARGAEEGVCG
ncbi:MAG: ATP-binding cassette domain-containing protein [Pseudonocardia sp.]